MHERARSMLHLGCWVFGVAVLAGTWEMVASQAPGSPLYIGMLPGPIGSLRASAFEFGVLLVLAGMLLGAQDLGHKWFGLLTAGTLLTLLAGAYGAARGMHGVQLYDLRADAFWLFLAKQLGRVLAYGALARAAWLALRKRA